MPVGGCAHSFAESQLHADLERADRELVRQAQELAEKEREQAEREARLAETSAMLEVSQLCSLDLT